MEDLPIDVIWIIVKIAGSKALVTMRTTNKYFRWLLKREYDLHFSDNLGIRTIQYHLWQGDRIVNIIDNNYYNRAIDFIKYQIDRKVPIRIELPKTALHDYTEMFELIRKYKIRNYIIPLIDTIMVLYRKEKVICVKFARKSYLTEFPTVKQEPEPICPGQYKIKFFIKNITMGIILVDVDKLWNITRMRRYL